MKDAIVSTVLGLLGLAVVVAIIGLFFAFSVVDAGERGVKTTWGRVSEEVLGEGIHFKVPYVQKIRKMDVKTTKIEREADSASKDLQSIATTVALNYHVNPSQANHLYQEIGEDYEERIVFPAIEESVKTATAQFTAEELITRRPEVKEVIREELKSRLETSYLIVDEFSIVNFSFSENFARAIEDKQTADQNAKRAENDLKRIKVEAQQKIEKSKGEAEAIRIEGEALDKNPSVLQLRSIEKWDGMLPKYMGGNADAVPFVDLQKDE